MATHPPISRLSRTTSPTRRPRNAFAIRSPTPIDNARKTSPINRLIRPTQLDASIADIRAGLRRAERTIEANARRRIRELRKEARAELRALQDKQREAAATLKKLSAAAGGSWREIRRSADSLFADARKAAAAIGKRFRAALRA
ncbi:MAG: hypothetical protein AB7S70_00050 [Hyphomicrobium sp.]